MMDFADYLYNMDNEAFEEVQNLVKIENQLPKTSELRIRLQKLRECLSTNLLTRNP